MYYALTINADQIITGVHESLTPITETTFALNPDLVNDTVVQIESRKGYEVDTDLRIYKEDGTKQTEAWQIENGYMELPKNTKIVDGVLVDWYKVFVQTDAESKIIAITSDAFQEDFTGWIQVDEGSAETYKEPQTYYLEKPLMTMQGIYRYKLADGKVVERTAEEIQADVDALPPPPPTLDEVTTELLALLIAQGVIVNV